MVVAILFLLASTGPALALRITPQNVQAMAIYGPTLNQAHTLAPNQIEYNITDPSLISELLEGIDFTRELDCSTLGSLANALIFIRFQNGDVTRYQVVNLWSHFSAYGFSPCCFAVSPEAQTILQERAQ